MRQSGLSNVLRPTKHIIGHIGDGFLQVNEPTNSVKALKQNVKQCDNIHHTNTL